MGRGGLDQPGRRALYEPSPDGSADPDEEGGVGPDELLMLDEALPEDVLMGDDEPFELDEADVEEFLEGHDLTEEQQALLDLFLSGTGSLGCRLGKPSGFLDGRLPRLRDGRDRLRNRLRS